MANRADGEHKRQVHEALVQYFDGQFPGRREQRRIARSLRRIADLLPPAPGSFDGAMRQAIDDATELLDPARQGRASERTRPIEPSLKSCDARPERGHVG